MLRKILFWVHLVAGVISGLAIGVMCFTGTVLAFEKELIAWSERDARKIERPPPEAKRLTLEEIQARLRAAQPEARTGSLVISNDPQAAIAFPAGRAAGFYVNPYTGEVRQPASSTMGRFMQTMLEWHRYLGFSGEESRPRGKLVNGICNLAFCALALTGLYLWWPRHWSWRGFKAIAVFNWRLAGKARDFNWHNAIGLWSAPVLIVLTLTAVPISFQWGGAVINSLTGTPTPTPGQPPPAMTAAAPIEVPPPPAGAQPLGQDALVAAVQKEIPTWQTITIGGGRGGPGGGRGAADAPGGRGGPGSRGGGEGRENGGGRGERSGGGAGEASARTANAARGPATFAVRTSDAWPRTATTTLALNPYSGEVLRRTGYAEQAPAQRVRSWTRFLHTGEALGWPGQLAAGLASLGGCVLVYTGFALAWRRLAAWRRTRAQT